MSDEKLPCGLTPDELTAAADRWGFDGIPHDPEELRFLVALERANPTPKPTAPTPPDPLRAEADLHQPAPPDTIRKPKWRGPSPDLEAMVGTNQPVAGLHGASGRLDYGPSDGVGPIYYGNEGNPR